VPSVPLVGLILLSAGSSTAPIGQGHLPDRSQRRTQGAHVHNQRSRLVQPSGYRQGIAGRPCRSVFPKQ